MAMKDADNLKKKKSLSKRMTLQFLDIEIQGADDPGSLG